LSPIAVVGNGAAVATEVGTAVGSDRIDLGALPEAVGCNALGTSVATAERNAERSDVGKARGVIMALGVLRNLTVRLSVVGLGVRLAVGRGEGDAVWVGKGDAVSLGKGDAVRLGAGLGFTVAVSEGMTLGTTATS